MPYYDNKANQLVSNSCRRWINHYNHADYFNFQTKLPGDDCEIKNVVRYGRCSTGCFCGKRSGNVR